MMKQIWKRRGWLIFLLPFVALCCAAGAALGVNGDLLSSYDSTDGYGDGPGEGETPEIGDCANLGKVYTDNPYHGWPVEYEEGNWGTVTFWFCELYPNGSPHWGIDLGGSIEGKAIVSTAERAWVRQAIACPAAEPCWNYGMGNFVQIEAQIRIADYQRCVTESGGNPDADACWQNTGWYATYMHLKDAEVEEGQIVRAGGLLGHVDNSGNSTGSHLHYQINSPSAGAVDPAPTMQ